MHLAYELLDGYEGLILVDAVIMGDAPGTVAVIEPEPVDSTGASDEEGPVVDAHSMSPEWCSARLHDSEERSSRSTWSAASPQASTRASGCRRPVAAAVDEAVDSAASTRR